MTIAQTDLEFQLADYLDQTMSVDYIDWACERMSLGDDSPALLALAAAYPRERKSDLRLLYQKSRQQLGLPQHNPEQLLTAGAQDQAETFLSGLASADQVLSRLYELYRASGYHLPFLGWANDLQCVADDQNMGGVIYPEQVSLNVSDLLFQECSAYLALSTGKQIEPNDQDLICQDCGTVNPASPNRAKQSKFQRLRKHFFPQPEPTPPRCQHCQSERLLTYGSLAGRQALATYC